MALQPDQNKKPLRHLPLLGCLLVILAISLHFCLGLVIQMALNSCGAVSRLYDAEFQIIAAVSGSESGTFPAFCLPVGTGCTLSRRHNDGDLLVNTVGHFKTMTS